MDNHMTTDLQDTINSACEDLDNWMKENPGNDEPHDCIFEIADSGVPVYYSTLLEWASEHNAFALDEPDIGPAFDGSPTPINIIAANIFEYIEGELWEHYNQHKDDYLELEDEELEAS